MLRRVATAALSALGLFGCAHPAPATSLDGRPETEAALKARIDRALEDYELAAFYEASRTYLRRFPEGVHRDDIRYGLAAQLMAENIATPTSAEAREAQRHFLALAQTSSPHRADAAFAYLKFGPPEDRGDRFDRIAPHLRPDEQRDALHYLVRAGLRAGLSRERRGHIEDLRHWAERFLAAGANDPRAPLSRRALDRIARVETVVPRRLLGAVPNNAQATLIDFWASWCEPCDRARPKLETSFRALTPALHVIGVSLDEDAGARDAYLKARPAPWREVKGQRAEALAAFLGTSDLPDWVILDERNAVVALGLSWPETEATLHRLLRPNQAPSDAAPARPSAGPEDN